MKSSERSIVRPPSYLKQREQDARKPRVFCISFRRGMAEVMLEQADMLFVHQIREVIPRCECVPHGVDQWTVVLREEAMLVSMHAVLMSHVRT